MLVSMVTLIYLMGLVLTLVVLETLSTISYHKTKKHLISYWNLFFSCIFWPIILIKRFCK